MSGYRVKKLPESISDTMLGLDAPFFIQDVIENHKFCDNSADVLEQDKEQISQSVVD